MQCIGHLRYAFRSVVHLENVFVLISWWQNFSGDNAVAYDSAGEGLHGVSRRSLDGWAPEQGTYVHIPRLKQSAFFLCGSCKGNMPFDGSYRRR